jgi:hypothetical protein
MVVCVSGSRGEENALAQKPLPRPSPPKWMHRAPTHTHTTNEQPLRESDCSETKAKQQTSRGGVLVVYIYYPQKIPPPEASDRPARDAPLSAVTDLAARGHVLSL